MRRIWRAVALSLSVGLVSAACSDSASPTTTSPVTTITSTSTTIAQTTTSTTASSTTSMASTTTTTMFVAVEVMTTGVVIAVEGNLAAIESFTIRTPDGEDLTLVPAPDLLFDGVAPISHVRDHFVSGAPVTVTFLTVEDGFPTVIAIGDADGGSHDH